VFFCITSIVNSYISGMEALSKKERYTFAGLLVNLLLQFILWSFSGFNSSWHFGIFWPFDGRARFKYFDITEFLVYGITPLAIFAIYYFVLRKKD
jgi:hypothetical protein